MQSHQIKFISEVIARDIEKKSKYSNNFKILEIGCGDGNGVKLMRNILEVINRDFNFEVYGLDYEAESNNVQKTDYNDEKLVKLKNTVDPYPFIINTFDYIFTNQVIEHIKEFDSFVRNSSRVLKEDGLLISLYPEKCILREPHCLIPLVHRLKNRNLMKFIVRNFYPFFSYLNRKKPLNPENMADYIVNNTFYRSRSEIRREFMTENMTVIWPITPSYATFHLIGNSFPVVNGFNKIFIMFINKLWIFWKSSLFISYKIK